MQVPGPELIAQHYQEAGNRNQAFIYWVQAGDIAERRAASREAIAHYRSALSLLSASDIASDIRGQEPELCMKLGNALMQAEGYSSAAGIQAYQRARGTAGKLHQLENVAKAGIGMAPLLFGECRYREVLSIIGEVSTDLNRLRPQTRVQLDVMGAVASYGIGQFSTSWKLLNSAIALDEDAKCTHENPIGGGDPAIVARNYGVTVANILGHFGRLASMAEEGLAIARSRQHAFTLAWALLPFGTSRRILGRHSEALAAFDESRAICERHGFQARIGSCLMGRGTTLFDAGYAEQGLADWS